MQNNATNPPQAAPNLRAQGASAEDIAAQFLEERGYRIVKRNFHFGRAGEMDIIAEQLTPQGAVLVFVEVKARTNDRFGSPESAITASKQRTLRRVAEGYLYTHGITNRECRFDVIAMEMQHEPPEIRHLIAAF